MNSETMRFIDSPLVNGLLFALYVIAFIVFFWLLFYIGRDKKKKHLYTKIKHLPAELKTIFDNSIPLNDNVQFFSYGVKDSRNSLFTHGFIAFLLICTLTPFIGILLSEILNETLVIFTLLLLSLLVIYWRYSIYRKHGNAMEMAKYRYGIFILKDQLVIRGDGWGDCIILTKGQIREVEDCKLWTSDSSEDDGIKFTISHPITEELNISGEFFGTTYDKVIDAIRKWRYSDTI